MDLEHAELVRRFRDKAYARDLNAQLIEIERLNPGMFRNLGSYIKGVFDCVQTIAGQVKIDYCDGDRSPPDDAGNSTELGDRRSGPDRRKTAAGE